MFGYELWGPDEWSAAGTWAGAIVTAVAVYLAATLSERSAERFRHRQFAEKMEVLAVVFNEARKLTLYTADALADRIPEAQRFSPVKHRTSPRGQYREDTLPSIPHAREFESVGAMLNAIPLLETPSWDAAQRLVSARNAISSAFLSLEKFRTDEGAALDVDFVLMDMFTAQLTEAVQKARRAAVLGRWPGPT